MTTLHYTFKALDVEAFEQALHEWAERVAKGNARDRRRLARQRVASLALDGKGLRGTHGEELPGVRLVALYDVHTGVMLARKRGAGPMTQAPPLARQQRCSTLIPKPSARQIARVPQPA